MARFKRKILIVFPGIFRWVRGCCVHVIFSISIQIKIDISILSTESFSMALLNFYRIHRSHPSTVDGVSVWVSVAAAANETLCIIKFIRIHKLDLE